MNSQTFLEVNKNKIKNIQIKIFIILFFFLYYVVVFDILL
jgi:hypothetical protein